MILEHKKIEIDQKVVFETIICNTESTFNFHLNDEAYFIYVNHGRHIAISPNEIVEVPEGNLGIVVGKSLILKAYPIQENQHYQVLIIHINREFVARWHLMKNLRILSLTNFKVLVNLKLKIYLVE